MMRPMDWRDYIRVDPRICHGKPTFKGTRIMVATILELLEASETYEGIKAGYPAIRPHHVHAAIQFARDVIQTGRVAAFQHARHAVAH